MNSFTYVSTNVPGPGCNLIDFHTELPGCCCCEREAKCDDVDDCVCLRGGQNYDSSTRCLLSLTGDQSSSTNYHKPVFECGSCCNCGTACSNRLIQFGIQVPLEVFDAGEKGYGLRTLTRLSRGQFVCEYAGELIDIAEASNRCSTLADGDPNYIFVLREYSSSSNTETVITTCVDPTRIGNLGRFINHSCDPNVAVVPVRYDTVVPHLGLFANRDIDDGQELCYDYGGGDQSGNLSTKACHCGATTCRGFLPLDKLLFRQSTDSAKT